jgi:ABC-type multidrug transport system fused ATPase/permease subunit
MSSRGGAAARLLRASLGHERGALGLVVAVLLVAMGLRLTTPALLGRFVDEAVAGEPLGALTTLAAAYVAIALTAEVLQLAVLWGSVRLSWRAGNRLRERLSAHALRLDMAWHGRYSPGQLIERIDGDVEAMVVFFAEVVVHVLGNVVLVLGMIVIAFVIDPWAGLILTITAVVGVAVMIKVRMAAVPAREAEREAHAVLYGDVEERLGGLEDLRANGAGAYAVHRLQTNSAKVWRLARRASWKGDGAYALAAMAFGLGTVATLATGILLQRRGAITVGAVLTLFRYSEMLRQPLERIAEQMKEMQKAVAGARRAADVLATEPAVAEGRLGPEALPPGALSVDFDAVTFAYRDRAPALRGVDLHLAPGTHLGVVGRTGSGKTTLGRLLLRFWDVDEGTVRVGGVDVRDLTTPALRGRLAVVTQDVDLFRASLRDNLTLFGALPATDDELHAVLRRVGLHRWAAAQPEGLDSFVAGGHGLSAGEAQLVAFARAFLRDADVVVLDEASSRLDPGTEARISEATHALLQGRTAVIVAHRLETLADVDEIVVLEDGVVVEHGPRDELAADPGSHFGRLLRTASSGLLLDEAAS